MRALAEAPTIATSAAECEFADPKESCVCIHVPINHLSWCLSCQEERNVVMETIKNHRSCMSTAPTRLGQHSAVKWGFCFQCKSFTGRYQAVDIENAFCWHRQRGILGSFCFSQLLKVPQIHFIFSSSCEQKRKTIKKRNFYRKILCSSNYNLSLVMTIVIGEGF